MTRWASTSWLVHSLHKLGWAHSPAVIPRANSANRASWSRNASAGLDTQVLPKKVGLVGEQLVQQRRVVDLEVIAVVMPNDTTRRPASDLLGVARIHQGLPPRHANQQRRSD